MKKNIKFWRPFWSYQLNSAADLTNLAQLWGELAELFSWLSETSPKTFLMDANTLKNFINYFMKMKQTLMSH